MTKHICWNPFNFAEIHADGLVYVCCPRYTNNFSIGNLFEVKHNVFNEIWNSDNAKEIRRGILNGSYSKCNKIICPYISAFNLSDRPIELPATINEEMSRGPACVKLAHDKSCNLVCPSCRNNKIVSTKSEQQQLDSLLEKIIPFLKDTKILNLSGDGDPFASLHYRKIILDTLNIPKLKLAFHTNGVLFDKKAWDCLKLENRVDFVTVSIDASTEKTYSLLRRGGDFKRLIENIKFLKSKREVHQINKLEISFVVQFKNYREMPDFVRLGKELGVDNVFFMLIRDWGGAADTKKNQVWNNEHPNYYDFLKVLKMDIMSDDIVDLGDVSEYVSRKYDLIKSINNKIFFAAKELASLIKLN